jgi:hypothetical protein
MNIVCKLSDFTFGKYKEWSRTQNILFFFFKYFERQVVGRDAPPTFGSR